LGFATDNADKKPGAGKKCGFFSTLDADEEPVTEERSKNKKSESFAKHNADKKPDADKKLRSSATFPSTSLNMASLRQAMLCPSTSCLHP
jgi:hypothetical protein